MVNLLRKDFLVMKKSLWLVLFYIIIFLILLAGQRENMFLVGVYGAFILLMLNTGNDIKNNNHRFLIHLPISRKNLITAKYISGLIYLCFGTVVSYLIQLSVSMYEGKEIQLLAFTQPVLSFGLIVVLFSIYLPVFYLLSEKGVQIINIVFMILLIAIHILTNIVRFAATKYQTFQSMESLVLCLIVAGSVVIASISYLLTVRLFSRRDL
ncbi:ABC-2 transporter permease [Paenibacillus sp. SYP-B3998]|uniref:ABC-2 transporter permease n=1 Tax=Paenibacillus sp. SYP-B3998 TaxID=2678564 RepID=A0A6G3ZX29_9BACL|nr:ABC-2 transporter permease [Paenibacillus sp. SYP-B3998]NEW06776.1 ABC-2 transporter permease [Paenibacillus sp. SYP-B3998]